MKTLICLQEIKLIVIKYGWWSDNEFIKMPHVVSSVTSDNLQRELYIKVPWLLDNLYSVGY